MASGLEEGACAGTREARGEAFSVGRVDGFKGWDGVGNLGAILLLSQSGVKTDLSNFRRLKGCEFAWNLLVLTSLGVELAPER